MAAASLETSIKDPSTEGLKPLAWMFVLGGMVILAAPTVFCLYMTYRRRVWALILLIALTGLDIAFYLHAVLNEGVGSSLSSYAALAANAVKLIAVILLVAPPSLAWFKGRDSTPRLG
jgi:hypothetical protein